MAVRTWNGSVNRFNSAADWLPAGVPQPGDVTVINSGGVTTAGETLDGLTIASAGEFQLGDGTTLAPDTQLTVSGGIPENVLTLAGQVSNLGIIIVRGPIDVFSTAGPTGIAGVLRNAGTINVVDGAAFIPWGRSPYGSVENDGVISVWASLAQARHVDLTSIAGGSGTVQLFGGAQANTQGTGTGQTFRFINGGKPSVLTLDAPSTFQGRIAGFAAPNAVSLGNLAYTSYAYASTGSAGGVLTLSDNGTTVASIAFDGKFQQSDFTVATRPPSGGSVQTDTGIIISPASGIEPQDASPQTVITTTVVPPAPDIELQDATLGLAALDASVAYAGPVAGLERQYVWASNDKAGIAALSPNAFLKGGPGSDALLATAGSNVLDGGGGSNFLAGAAGMDTFFVDGRAGPAWDTILNFQPGDAMALFGFRVGQDTFSWTASDGAAGFEGATLHAELGGAGGAEVSVTFARIGLDEAQGRFTLSTGSTEGVGYLYAAHA